MALYHLGSDGLLLVVVDLRSGVTLPKKPIVEHLSTKQVSQDVLNILKVAQERVGAFMQGRTPVQGAS